jgi:putative hydrolase of the HAD superfamily
VSPDIDAILFDLDSTLTDRPASILKYARLFHEHFETRLKRTSPAQLAIAIEELDLNGYAPRHQVFEGMLRMDSWSSVPDVQEISDHWLSHFAGCAAGRDDMQQTLETLVGRGYRLGIVTNGTSQAQRGKVETLGVTKYLDTVIISKEVGCAKPDPAIFAHAVHNLGLQAGRCLFVGDHPINDVSGAASAGLVPIWFEGVFPWPEALPPPSRRISRLGDLLELT